MAGAKTTIGGGQTNTAGMPEWMGSTPLSYADQLSRRQAYDAFLGKGGSIGQAALADWYKISGERFDTPSVARSQSADITEHTTAVIDAVDEGFSKLSNISATGSSDVRLQVERLMNALIEALTRGQK
jgi:hypothetical protein